MKRLFEWRGIFLSTIKAVEDNNRCRQLENLAVFVVLFRFPTRGHDKTRSNTTPGRVAMTASRVHLWLASFFFPPFPSLDVFGVRRNSFFFMVFFSVLACCACQVVAERRPWRRPIGPPPHLFPGPCNRRNKATRTTHTERKTEREREREREKEHSP